MKKVIWGQLSKIILFFFNYSLGRDALRSIFSNLLAIVSDDDVSDEIRDESHKCGICTEIFTMKTVMEGCQHAFCYFCIEKHRRLTNDLCPVCFQK